MVLSRRSLLTGTAAVAAGAGGAYAAPAGTWVLAEVGGHRVTAGGQRPFLTIDGRKVSGFDGCNRFYGSLDEPGGIASTRRGCEEPVLMLPLDLNRLTEHMARARVRNGRLEFPAHGGFPDSAFVRSK